VYSWISHPTIGAQRCDEIAPDAARANNNTEHLSKCLGAAAAGHMFRCCDDHGGSPVAPLPEMVAAA
jgi:hypothetical protein